MQVKDHFRMLPFACIALLTFALPAFSQSPTYSGTCPNGAPARDEKYCHFFVHFNKDSNSPLDIRIAEALEVKTASETRSIGLIVAIDKYPMIPGGDISAAAVDARRLQDFLIQEQKFDEVILLRNEEATVDNINYFLEDYLVNRPADFNKKARLLIAYSGHGRFGTSDGAGDTQAAFILSGATDVNGYTNIYKMQNFAQDIEFLAPKYFHIITLINACYGGGFFTSGSLGGNADAYRKPGSYAITAGTDRDVTIATDASRGSVFFDQLITGITTGDADLAYKNAYGVVDVNGAGQYLGLARTNALMTYLTTQFELISKDRRKSAPDFRLNEPWIGPAQPGIARGGFFFLSATNPTPASHAMVTDRGTLSRSRSTLLNESSSSHVELLRTGGMPVKPVFVAAAQAVPMAQPAPPSLPAVPKVQNVPLGPISSIPGRPDIKIFKAPDVYPVQGLDISSQDGKVDWKTVSETFEPTFIYLRAVAWKGPDKRFRENLLAVKALNLDYGAYFKYDFCLSPKAQIERLLKIFPPDPNALPVSIEIVNPRGEDNHQLECLSKLSMKQAKADIFTAADIVEKTYGKTPLLYGNHFNLYDFYESRFDRFMIWLGHYGTSGVEMRGRNPWTLWQYSGTLNVKGIGSRTTGDVFFGTREQYQIFKRGQGNTALQAVQPLPTAHLSLPNRDRFGN